MIKLIFDQLRLNKLKHWLWLYKLKHSVLGLNVHSVAKFNKYILISLWPYQPNEWSFSVNICLTSSSYWELVTLSEVVMDGVFAS